MAVKAYKVKDVDHGYKNLVELLFKGQKPKIEVGILAADGAVAHVPEGQEAPKQALTVADVATMHEFGLGVPERSFLRAWFDKYQGQAVQALTRLMQESIRTNGKPSPEQTLNQTGAWIAGKIQQYINASQVKPELAESTIKRKGSSVPLKDTGQLVSAISFRISGIKKTPKPIKQGKVTGFNSKKSKAARKKIGKKAKRAVARARKFANRVKYKGGKLAKLAKRSVQKQAKTAVKSIKRASKSASKKRK